MDALERAPLPDEIHPTNAQRFKLFRRWTIDPSVNSVTFAKVYGITPVTAAAWQTYGMERGWLQLVKRAQGVLTIIYRENPTGERLHDLYNLLRYAQYQTTREGLVRPIEPLLPGTLVA